MSMTQKHYFFILALILALAVRFPVSEDVFHAYSLSVFSWLFPLVGWLLIMVFYGLLRLIVSHNIAMIYTVALAFFVPMIVASRTPVLSSPLLMVVPVIFFLVAFFTDIFWRSEQESKRSLSVIVTTFVVAFTMFHLVQWDGLFVREYSGMHQQVESLAETLKGKTVFVIDPEGKFTQQLRDVFHLNVEKFDIVTFHDRLDELESTDVQPYVLSDGQAYKDALTQVKNIVYRLVGTQKIAANASEQTWIPQKMVPVVHEMSLLKVAGSLGRL